MPQPRELNGISVLVVEDEPLIAMEIAAILEEAGVVVIGPAGSLEQAHRLIEEAHACQAALLDVNVAGKSIDSVAQALTNRKIPFAFMTGYSGMASDAPVIRKPFMPEQVCDVLRLLIAQ